MGYISGAPGPGAVQKHTSPPLYGGNKHGGMIDSGANSRRTIVFDVAVTDAVVAGSTDQNAVLWTLGADTLLEGIAVKNVGDNPLASGATLKIDDGTTDFTSDIQNLAAGDIDCLTFRLPTAAGAAIKVDGTAGFKCGAGLTTTVRVALYIVDAAASFDNV